MNEELTKLIKRYPKLAKSVLEGAKDAVDERLLPHGGHCTIAWYDGSKEWYGKHVEKMSNAICKEIISRIDDILNINQSKENEDAPIP